MVLKLKVRSIYQIIYDKSKPSSNSKLLKLNEYKIENKVSYEAKINNVSEIVEHLGVLNDRVSKFSELFKDDSYKHSQTDLITNLKICIANDDVYCEHIYFIETKSGKLFIVRQFYGKKKRQSLFSKDYKYELQQIIYNVQSNTNRFAIFESSDKYKSTNKGAEKSKNEPEESESEEKSRKSSKKSENDADDEQEEEVSTENIEDVEESISILRASITKSKLEKIAEGTDEENSKSKEKNKK
jgi:hypothetical protein